MVNVIYYAQKPYQATIMTTKLVTLWERFDDEQQVWQHNHIVDGDDPGDLPTPLNPAFVEQVKSWSKGTWRKRLCHLVDGVLRSPGGPAEDTLRSLSSWLGQGGQWTEPLDVANIEIGIRAGVDHLLSVETGRATQPLWARIGELQEALNTLEGRYAALRLAGDQLQGQLPDTAVAHAAAAAWQQECGQPTTPIPPGEATLHVYAQYTWHDNAYLAGTPSALRLVRDAIAVALGDARVGTVTAFVNDGEGYDFKVIAASEEEMHALAVPYTDELARDGNDALFPWRLLAQRVEASKHQQQETEVGSVR